MGELKCLLNCYCCQCCQTLVIADYSLCTSCPGRPYCSVGLWWWVKRRGLGWQDTRHASSVFKTSSWQAVASHHWGANGCGSDTNYWQLSVNMICFLIEVDCECLCEECVSFKDQGISLRKYGPLNVTLFKHVVVILLIMLFNCPQLYMDFSKADAVWLGVRHGNEYLITKL